MAHQRKRKYKPKRYTSKNYDDNPGVYFITELEPEPYDGRISDEDKQRMLKKSFHDEDSVILTNALSERMSDVLMDYAKPLLKENIEESDIPEMEVTLQTAIFIWNMAIMKRAKLSSRMRLLDRLKMWLGIKLLLRKINKPHLYSVMLKRKHELYPDNRRLITGLEVTWDYDGPYVKVLSTVDDRVKDEAAKMMEGKA
jgi:hypothetical protein